jgi:hypothetical protein
MTEDMVMTLVISHSVTSDLFIRLEIGDGRLLLAWPLGHDTNGGRWTCRVSDLVEGLLYGYNRQIIIRRGRRTLESTTMVVTKSGRRQVSVSRSHAGVLTVAVSARFRGRSFATRRIRFVADAPRAVQLLLDIASPHQADQWRELGCSRAAARYVRSPFYLHQRSSVIGRLAPGQQ